MTRIIRVPKFILKGMLKMNDMQKELQKKLKSVKGMRQDLEMLKERCKTYESICAGNELAKYKKELTQRRKELLNCIDTIQDEINRLDDNIERNVLSMYYIDCLQMPDIAEKMFYSEQWLWTKHRSALNHLISLYK